MLTEERMIVREGARSWWLFLVAGIAWLVIAWLVLRANETSLATVGYLLGAVFIVAGINEKHAREHAAIGRDETVALLRQNSRAAAEAVRAFSDEQLDRAAPVSLNGDAPLTTQFFIEDHALRHSWHHLAKIKRAVQGDKA